MNSPNLYITLDKYGKRRAHKKKPILDQSIDEYSFQNYLPINNSRNSILDTNLDDYAVPKNRKSRNYYSQRDYEYYPGKKSTVSRRSRAYNSPRNYDSPKKSPPTVIRRSRGYDSPRKSPPTVIRRSRAYNSPRKNTSVVVRRSRGYDLSTSPPTVVRRSRGYDSPKKSPPIVVRRTKSPDVVVRRSRVQSPRKREDEEEMMSFDYDPMLAEKRRRHFVAQKRVYDENPEVYVGNVQHGRDPVVFSAVNRN